MKGLPSADLLGLALAPMGERVAALRFEWGRTEEPGPFPSRAVQVAGLVVGETVRLIRLGDRSEVTGAARELSKLVAGHTPDAAVSHPESYRLAAGASVVLGAAGSPSSAGAEFAVLRSWNGKAKQAVELLNRAHGKALARSELRAELGDLTESHLSHLLADLESAGLALRIKEGRTVTVHLGPTAKRDHVQERLTKEPLPVAFRSTERDIDPGLRRQIEGVYMQASVGSLPGPDLKVQPPPVLYHFSRAAEHWQKGLFREVPDWSEKTVLSGHLVSKEGLQRPTKAFKDEDVPIADLGFAVET
jgi:DNA-binding transcriptional ArsR family regulator